MSLRVKDKQHFKKYNKIWEKVQRLMGIKFDSKPFYGNDDNKYIKTKIKKFTDRVIKNFHNEKVPEENVSYKCLSIIILDSVIKSDKKYYPQTYLEECKYKQQQQQQQQQQKQNYSDEDFKSDSDSNDETESDSDSNNDETKSDVDNNE